MNGWLPWLWVIAGVVGCAMGYRGETREDASRAATGGSGGGSSEAGAAAVNSGSDVSNQSTLEARRYDPEGGCYWDSTPIAGFYLVEQLEYPDATIGPVCLISDTGDAYVVLVATSKAVMRTDSTAAWKAPTWTANWSGHYEYSAFTREQEALCRSAIDGVLRNGSTFEGLATCTTGAEGAGGSEAGSAGPTSTAGAAASSPVAPPGCDGVIKFPDAGLEAAVRYAIQMPTGDIRFEHVAQLSELIANGHGVRDLTGLRCLQGLTGIDLGDNSISDLSPLSGLPSLFRLLLPNNNISDLGPLSALTSLTYLDLNQNEVSDLTPLSGLIQLYTLYLGGNNVTDLSPLSGLTDLTVLGLESNDISDLAPLSGLTRLRCLYVDQNNVTDLTPLVANPMFADCGTEPRSEELCLIVMYSNPVDCTRQADNIRTLEERAVVVELDCPPQ